jgi:plasmid stabilization system protein ParE
MPKPWTDKEDRQYEHIKDSVKARGESLRKAKEIAARTVNKQRRKQGKTSSRRTTGTGNPNRPLAEHTRDELYNQAADQQIVGRSKMSKAQLVIALGG